jgi:DNA invertase Pin-like site-specific DNA recombinase
MVAHTAQQDGRMFPVGFPYKRFSNPSQETGDSVRRQNALSFAWSEKNGVPLDTNLTLEDRGVSGFKGVSRSDPDRYALAAFLKAIEIGRVQAGDYLLIENLDRLSRESEVPATHLLTSILMKGIKVVQLSPYEMELTDKSDGWTVMRAVMELSRGHGESRIKSIRVAQAKARRREEALAGKKALTGRLPAWIRLGDDGRPHLIPERAAVVKRIFDLAGAGGHGICAIVARLTTEGVPTFGTREPLLDETGHPLLTRTGRPRHRATKGEYMGSGHWTRAYIYRILSDRRALGELQPRLRDGTPIGDPVSIPSVVSEKEWLAARAGASQRGKRPGRTSNHLNIFAHLVRDARTGSSYYCSRRRGQHGVLVTTDAAEGRAACVSFPMETFEAAVLEHLDTINERELLAQEEPDEVSILGAQKDQVVSKLAKVEASLEAELDAGEEIPQGTQRVQKKYEAQLREIEEKLRKARQKAVNPIAETWGQAHGLFRAAQDPDKRLRLRSLLRQLVSEIRLLAVPRGRDRLAAVQIWFSGGQHRDYLVLHRPPLMTGGKRREGLWRSRSVDEGVYALDLRVPGQARLFEQKLEALDLAELLG